MKGQRQRAGVEVAGDVLDHAPGREQFLADVIAGLSSTPKTLPCKYFYDERGAKLFEQICELPEYYPTRTELAIMREHAGEMAELIGPDALLIEYGSGEGLKTRILLEALQRPAGYVPVDISREQLEANAEKLREEFPGLEVLPVCADYTGDYEIPEPEGKVARRVVYFPGSTIGNFTPWEAKKFLAHVREVFGPGGGLLIGFDLIKDLAILEAAYNDAQGVTAAFNLNLLRRINRELGGDFALSRWGHRAHWNGEEGRIEMHLISGADQMVHIAGIAFEFRGEETVHTENSYKYHQEAISGLADATGWGIEKVWLDPREHFSVHLFSNP